MPPTLVSAPMHKRPHARYFAREEILALYLNPLPIELITHSKVSAPCREANFLPHIATGDGGRTRLMSRSFTEKTCRAISRVLGLPREDKAVVLPNGPWTVQLSYASEGPSFTHQLNDVPGPTSLALFCKGLADFNPTGTDPIDPFFSSRIQVGATELSVLMLRVENVWIELLERHRMGT